MNYTDTYSYNVNLISKNSVWETVLNQEGVLYKIVDTKQKLSDFIVVTSQSDIDTDTFFSHIKNGGTAIIESNKFAEFSRKKSVTIRVKYFVSEKKSLFNDVGLVDVQNKLEYFPFMEFLDSNLKISYKKIGKGHIVILPFNLKKIFSNHTYSRMKFYSQRDELPSEDVSSVSKNRFVKIISRALRFLHDKKNLPYITKWYYNSPHQSFFSFRIDTDFCNLQDAKELYDLIEKYDIHSTWFIDTSNLENIKTFYSKLGKNHEVGLHAYRHLVYKDYKSNFDNITTGLDILKSYKINPVGFAAPFGEWNITLQAVIDKYFKYSSEFTYDYDNFPSYPYVANRFSKAMQIPVHPISIGRLIRSHFTAEEMTNYYLDIIQLLKQDNIPIIIYHHPHHRYFEVIEEIFKVISSDNQIQKGTMRQLYEIWKEKEKNQFEITLKDNKIFPKKLKGYIRIIYKGKTVVTNTGKDLSEYDWHKIDAFNYPEDIHRTRKPHWRDYLYNYEKMRSKSRL